MFEKKPIRSVREEKPQAVTVIICVVCGFSCGFILPLIGHSKVVLGAVTLGNFFL